MKVKGHAKLEDVASGAVAKEDKWGNDKADELATLGATLHRIDPSEVRNFRYRVLLAVDLQNMMIEILADKNATRKKTSSQVEVVSISSISETEESNSSRKDSETVSSYSSEIPPAPD